MEKKNRKGNNKRFRLAMFCFAILSLALMLITLVLENINNHDTIFSVLVLTMIILTSLLILLVYFIFAEGNRALGFILNSYIITKSDLPKAKNEKHSNLKK